MAEIPLKYMVKALDTIGAKDGFASRSKRGIIYHEMGILGLAIKNGKLTHYYDKPSGSVRRIMVYRYGTRILTIRTEDFGSTWSVVDHKITSVSDRDVLNSIFVHLGIDARASYGPVSGPDLRVG